MDPDSISEGEELYWDNPRGPERKVKVVRGYNGYNVLVGYTETVEVEKDGTTEEVEQENRVQVNPEHLSEEYGGSSTSDEDEDFPKSY